MRLFILLATAILIGCQVERDLNGVWMADGYNCYGNSIEEIIQLTHNSDSVVAIKIIGDDCIEGGDLTWRGIIENDSIVGTMVGLIPTTMKKVEAPMVFHIINEDSIYVQPTPLLRITFSRMSDCLPELWDSSKVTPIDGSNPNVATPNTYTKFNHSTHINIGKLECGNCHMTSSTSVKEDFNCSSCH